MLEVELDGAVPIDLAVFGAKVARLPPQAPHHALAHGWLKPPHQRVNELMDQPARALFGGVGDEVSKRDELADEVHVGLDERRELRGAEGLDEL